MKWDAQQYKEKYDFVYKYGEGLVEMLDPQPNERILDIGCGTGYLSSKIAERCNEVIGIDLSEEMVNTAREQYPTIQFIVADATTFSDGTGFDALFSNATLHWIADQEKLNTNMFSLLKKGGRMMVEFGGKDNVATIFNALRATLSDKGYSKQSQTYPWYYPSIGEYATALEKAGFRVVKAEHYDRPTLLADEKDSMKNWINMFGKYFFEGVTTSDKEIIINTVIEKLKPLCFVDNRWIADYKRIRISALKE